MVIVYQRLKRRIRLDPRDVRGAVASNKGDLFLRHPSSHQPSELVVYVPNVFQGLGFLRVALRQKREVIRYYQSPDNLPINPPRSSTAPSRREPIKRAVHQPTTIIHDYTQRLAMNISISNHVNRPDMDNQARTTKEDLVIFIMAQSGKLSSVILWLWSGVIIF